MRRIRDTRRTDDSANGGGRGLVSRTILLSVLWWALVEGRLGGWPLALLIVSSALAVTFALTPRLRHPVRVGGLVRFVPFFVSQSIAGGIDVARRAFDPRLPLATGFIEHSLELPPGAPSLFFTGTVSLLPGTLSVEAVEEGGVPAPGEGPEAAGDPGEGQEGSVLREVRASLRVHLLDTGAPAARKLQDLERRVADLFGV